MFNMICVTAAEFADKAKEAGIVVLIGVAMVFVILALVIGVIKILKVINSWLNTYDAHMAIVRERKAEIKKSKIAMKEHFALKQNEILASQASGEITKEQSENALADLQAEKAKAIEQLKVDKIQTNIKYDTVFNVINEANYRIKKLIKAENQEYKTALKAISGDNKKQDIEALKTARILKKVELNNNIKHEEKERDARVALAKSGFPVPANESHGNKAIADSQMPDVTDSKLIVAITAAVAMMMSEETTPKKAGFTVRSIKLVK